MLSVKEYFEATKAQILQNTKLKVRKYSSIVFKHIWTTKIGI